MEATRYRARLTLNVSLNNIMVSVKALSGLPPYGPLAAAFPVEWGRCGREGFVVEFTSETGR